MGPGGNPAPTGRSVTDPQWLIWIFAHPGVFHLATILMAATVTFGFMYFMYKHRPRG